MSYIGKTPLVGNYQICDALTASATADYTLQVGSVNVVPESANAMIVSLNSVIQGPGASRGFTVSGSTISFNTALTSSDVIDFIYIFGDVLDIGTPTDGTVTAAKLAADAVITAKILDSNVTTAKIADNNVTLAKLGDGTQGDVLYYGASGAPARLGFGTSGDFLKTQGTGANPVWATPSGGKTVKRHYFSMSTRTAGVGTLADQYTVTSSFTPTLPTAGNNDLFVEWVSPKNGSDHAYTNIGLRFNDGITDYDYPVGNMSSRANDLGFAGGVFNIAAGTIPAGTYSIIVRAFITSSAPDYWNPNTSDNSKLTTQTYTSVMITEYKN